MRQTRAGGFDEKTRLILRTLQLPLEAVEC